jgi:hypothetical protein
LVVASERRNRREVNASHYNLHWLLEDYRLKPVDSFPTESRTAAEAA